MGYITINRMLNNGVKVPEFRVKYRWEPPFIIDIQEVYRLVGQEQVRINFEDLRTDQKKRIEQQLFTTRPNAGQVSTINHNGTKRK